jgi:hypothetical protein
MSITVLCPQGHPVVLDDPARPALACPRCGSVFPTHGDVPEVPSVPGGMAARSERRKSRDEDEEDEEEDDRPRKRKVPVDDDDDEEDERPRKRALRRPEQEDEEDDDEAPQLTRKQRQLSMVRLGILFHILKLWVFMAALVFFFITLPLALFAGLAGMGLLATFLWQITFNLSMTLAPILGIVGSVLCAWVPPRSEARGTIIVSTVFDLLAPFFGLLQLIMWFGFFVTFDDRVSRLIDYMLYARLACTIVAWWLFQIYLRKVCFYMRESLLASECLNVIVHLMIATIIGPTLVAATVVMTLFFSLCIGFIAFCVTFGWLIYFAVTFPIRQFRLLFLVRAKIYNKFLKPDDDD